MTSTIMKAIAFIELIIGIIGSIAGGVIYQNELDELLKRTSISTSDTYLNNTAFESGFTLAVTWIIGVLILFVILFSIATILDKVENIEKKQSKDTMWALSTLIDKLKTIENKQLSQAIQNEITHAYNADTDSSETEEPVQRILCASCNKDLTDDIAVTPILKICPYCDKPIYPQSDEWECKSCGETNPSTVKFCKTCGSWRG